MVSLLSSRVSAPDSPAPAPRRRGSISRGRRRLGLTYAAPMAVLVAVFFVRGMTFFRWLRDHYRVFSLVGGVILVGLGSLWLIDRYIEIDWSFMETWGGPAAFILLGLILIVSHIRKRRAENDAQIGMPPRSR